MKKTLLSLLFVSLASIAFGQSEARSDTTISINTDKYRVVTNRYFENWFAGISAGGQVLLGDHDKQMQFLDRITPAIEGNIGKWFTPGIGVRLGYTGYQLKGLTHNSWSSAKTHSTGEIYEDVRISTDLGKLEVQKFNYNHIHWDVLFNLSHIFKGYNESRFYTISPYAGVGWAWVTTGEPRSSEPTINIGFYNSFRLNHAFNLTLDARGVLLKDDFDGELGRRKEEGIASISVGFVYNFGKRNWDREKILKITLYDEAELNLLRERVNQLVNDQNALKRQLEESANKDITDIKIDRNVAVVPILITFPINKSTVSNEARVNLGFLAKAIKAGNPNVVYNISGYADKGTGSKAINERLSRERAEAIYNVLVREFGVPASQLTISYYGGVDNMYYDDPRLSRAVIVLGR